MADAEGLGGDRTEAPTARRLQRARDAGQAPVSRELSGLAVLAAGALMLGVAAPAGTGHLAHQLAFFFTHITMSPQTAFRFAAEAALGTMLPVMGVALFCGAAAVLLQSGFLISAAPLRPDFARINPVAGLRRLISFQSLIEAGKSVIKLAVTMTALWRVLTGDLPQLMTAPFRDVHKLAASALLLSLHVMLAVIAVQAAIAVLDVVIVRVRHARNLRMSRVEVREEQKDLEGDPKIKARLRRLRVQRARRRMLAAVPKATVVITNPTHYAVALSYDRAKSRAPTVVAKGVDFMAERIREIAIAHAVPLVANPPLAHVLYRLELDTDIPPEHYKVVAEIIAYVWRLRGRLPGLAAAVAGPA
jgi:flagellar biosynthesis protein FlhB